MTTLHPSLVLLFSLYLTFTLLSFPAPAAAWSDAYSNGNAQRKPYILHMINSMKPHPFTLHEHWYASLLRQVSGFKFHPSQFLYSYNHALHGFAASLTSAESKALQSMDSCLAVTPSSFHRIHTTHSPKFLGLSPTSEAPNGLWSLSNYGEDVIVGVIDTGIWPESKSFNDAGLGPVPARWKGECESGVMFNSSHCNRKIIGARNFPAGWEAVFGKINNTNIDYRSPRDMNGHGSHCASTVAGSAAPWSNFSGFGNGTAMGMAPRARLAIYKAAWGSFGTLTTVDIAKAVDKAIEDGVDIISMSVGGIDFDDVLRSALQALKNNIFVSMAAGNNGPSGAILNSAPWVITVGASSLDRQFPAPVTLGNLETYKGTSFYTGRGVEKLPLVYAFHNVSSMNCLSGTLHSDVVKDKVVVCDLKSLMDQGMEVKRAGGAGMILVNPEAYGGDEGNGFYVTDAIGLPATLISFWSGQKIKAYINTTRTPTATITTPGLTVVGRAIRAPIVAAFSSRGPSIQFPDVLKPDLIAPGVSILAAWTKGSYKIESGTSMACPHVSGIAALIKAVHPSWSPSAIRSALMTSSYVRDNKRQLIKDVVDLKPATPFAMGAGHVNPAAAVDPGLVYDMGFQDYVDFLCSTNVSNKDFHLITRNKSLSCPKSNSAHMEAGDLNYPSFSVIFTRDRALTLHRRSVTNVGGGSAVYRVAVKSPPHVSVSVEPTTLTFKKQNETLSYSVRFESKVNARKHNGQQEFGRIIWKCIEGGHYTVHSPVATVWNGK